MQEEQSFLAQLCFQVPLLGHVTHAVTAYQNTVSHQNRYATNSPSTTQEMPYPCPGPKYSTAVLPPPSPRVQPRWHDMSSRGGQHSRNWEFIQVSHACSVWLWGIPCLLHKNEPRTKHLPRRVAMVCSRKEKGGEHHKHPTPHSTAASRLEAVTHLLHNTYCSKMEEKEGAREVGRTPLNSNYRDGGSKVKRFHYWEPKDLLRNPGPMHKVAGVPQLAIDCCAATGQANLCASVSKPANVGIWAFALLQQGLLRLGVCSMLQDQRIRIILHIQYRSMRYLQHPEAWQFA